MTSAYSSTSLSTSENSALLRYSGNASIFSRDMQLCLLTAEPISIQNGHPISVATRNCAKFFRPASTIRLAPSDNSICAWPQRILLW